MKFYHFLSLLIFAGVLMNCERDDNFVSNQDQIELESTTYNENLESRSLENDLETFIFDNYGLVHVENENQRLYTQDGLYLDIIEIVPDEKYILSGTIIYDEIGLKINQNGNGFNEVFEFMDSSFQNVLSESELGQAMANDPTLFDPEERTFGECFKDEWTNFCEDFISCAAQIANPWSVAGAISIFCAFLDD